MSCQSSQIPYDFNTDHQSVKSCDRNNCRCGSSKNCMYYNDGDKSHYNYFAVQGTGSIENSEYSCANKAYDYYNDNDMYGDHALGSMGAYGTEDGEKYGEVNYDDAKCSEHGLGQLDMCDKCNMDKPDFYEKRNVHVPMLTENRLYQDVDIGFNVGQYSLEVEIQRWLLCLTIIVLLYYLNKNNMLPGFVKGILNKKAFGYSLLSLSAYFLVGYIGFVFFC